MKSLLMLLAVFFAFAPVSAYAAQGVSDGDVFIGFVLLLMVVFFIGIGCYVAYQNQPVSKLKLAVDETVTTRRIVDAIAPRKDDLNAQEVIGHITQGNFQKNPNFQLEGRQVHREIVVMDENGRVIQRQEG